MKVEDVLQLLEAKGLTLKERKRLPNDTGDQLLFETGEIVNVFDKGSVNAQGKNTTQTKAWLNGTEAIKTTSVAPPKKVFVVYGHDHNARTQLEALLLRWNIEPLILDQLPSEGQTVIEKLESYTQKAQYAIILATPDDEGHTANKPDEKQFRARQNVVLELGMLLAKLGRSKVAILIKDQKSMEKPSDISGLVYIPFVDNVEDAKTQLYKEMCAAGFSIDPQKL